MKTVGLIGGIGPESTIEYYRFIIAAFRKAGADGSYPSILVNSVDMTKMLGLVSADEREKLVVYLSDEVDRLVRAGADFIAFASNTPHIVFEDVRRRINIPMISIVEVTCDAAVKMGLKRVGLFGARFTMDGEFYSEVFSPRGIEIVRPEIDERAFIHDKYMNELVNGIILPKTREQLLSIADTMIQRDGIDGLILGGTELPLILTEKEHNGIPLLNTTLIHVERITAELLS